MLNRKIIIGSRGSDLALWQANFVKEKLSDIGVKSEVKIIKTQGDKEQELSFDKMEGKGFFTREIEEALLNKEIDLAVHSYKDLETVQPKGLRIAAVSGRADASELLLINTEAVDSKKKFSLKAGATVGTSSARRKCQLKAHREDINLKDLRGNVPTRVRKLMDGEYDAILIAAAGVDRLGLDVSGLHAERLDPWEFIPAPAQGVLAMQIREEDKDIGEELIKISDQEVARTSAVEREVLHLMEGGCQLPLGVFCKELEDQDGATVFDLTVSMAEKWDDVPKYIRFTSKRQDDIARLAVDKLNNSQPTSVFITRDLLEGDFFHRCLAANGYEVHGKALIKLLRIEFKELPKVDWIFFSSKNAVKHFYGQKPEVNGAQIGAIGRTTAAEVRKYGHSADFVGYSTDTKMTAKQFLAKTGNGKILFPQAKGSVRTVQRFARPENVINLLVYETRMQNEEKVKETEIVFFTSPSNVMAFFEKNELKDHQKIIALGYATGSALERKGVNTYSSPLSFDGVGMVQVVFGIK